MNENSSFELQYSIASHLCQQGLSEQVAEAFSKVILDHVLTWRVESPCSADDCNAIMGVAFGYQVSSTGKRRPGPVNEALAELVLKHYRRRPRPVYAQREIAALLAAKLPAHHFYPIKAESSKNGSSKQCATEWVIAEIANQLKDPQPSAPWLLIAHRHHSVRCAMIAAEKGFGRVVTAQLPDSYDYQCGQLWRRRHLPYLVSDVISRLTIYATNSLYPALVRSQRAPANSSARQDITEKALSPAPSLTDAECLKDSSKEQLNGDVPLLPVDEDYAAIPCYKSEQSTPLTPTATARTQQSVEQRRGDWRDIGRTKPARSGDSQIIKRVDDSA